MDLYVFASRSVTNIWAGVGARMWAVSRKQAANIPNLAGKATRMLVGSSGVIYCSATQSLTTPFVVASRARPDQEVTDVWPEPWTLPFGIHPLGTPHRQLHKDRLSEVLPTLQRTSQRWDQLLHIQPATVFVPSEVGNDDWQALLEHLADARDV